MLCVTIIGIVGQSAGSCLRRNWSSVVPATLPACDGSRPPAWQLAHLEEKSVSPRTGLPGASRRIGRSLVFATPGRLGAIAGQVLFGSRCARSTSYPTVYSPAAEAASSHRIKADMWLRRSAVFTHSGFSDADIVGGTPALAEARPSRSMRNPRESSPQTSYT